MTFSVHGIAVQGGIAIGRAVRIVSSRAGVAHYFIRHEQVISEITRVRVARDAVLAQMHQLQESLASTSHKDTPQELSAIMDVHIMLLQDETLTQGVKHWIADRHYNAEWALTTQLELIAAQFDEMHDAYMRERKGDLEQVVERLLVQLQGGQANPVQAAIPAPHLHADDPLILVAHDLSPADMMQFKSSVFGGFVTDVGGRTSHTAIVARSLGIPAIVGAKSASTLVRQDDWVVVDANAGVLIVNPSDDIMAHYEELMLESLADDSEQDAVKHEPIYAADGTRIQVLANIELPSDTAAALAAGAEGIGLFRTEYLFMGRQVLPTEEEQYEAYRDVVKNMGGLPVTIRTIDIGADKPLDAVHTASHAQANPALGLRAIRWCLAEPAMFQTQLRALLRAAVHGRIKVLIPMLAHESEIKQCLLLVDRARVQLDTKGIAYGEIELGAMIEIPAAALIVPTFLKYFDFLSIGTNDLIQYTLAVDRADESVAHLYDGNHPAVQFLIQSTIEQCVAAKKEVSVCGEMAGDVNHLQALLAMGLRVFSMHPNQVPDFKYSNHLSNNLPS
jgi:phosphoenolpyruvate-protein phosphotransferase (PTS system enzyme I)